MSAAAAPFDYGSLFAGPPQGYLPYGQNVSDPYSAYTPDFSQGNPAYAMKQNRGYAAAWGGQMGQQLTDQQAQNQYWQNAYQQAMNTSAAGILNAPGYTPGEMGNIVN